MGMAKFDPSQNQNPVIGWDEIVNKWLRPGDMPPNLFVKIRAAGASGESGENITSQIFLYTYLFFLGSAYKLHPLTDVRVL